MEKTLALVKPDAVSAGSAGSIVHRAELDGFVVVDKRTLQVRERAPPFFSIPPFFFCSSAGADGRVRAWGSEGAPSATRARCETVAGGIEGVPSDPRNRVAPRDLARAVGAALRVARVARARAVHGSAPNSPPPAFFVRFSLPKKKARNSVSGFWRARARAPDSPTRSDAGRAGGQPGSPSPRARASRERPVASPRRELRARERRGGAPRCISRACALSETSSSVSGMCGLG